MDEQKVVKIDKIDKMILFELDKDCRTPSSKIAKKTRKSRQTIEYRIKKLVENGVITSFDTSINPHKMGYRIYKIYLKLKNITEQKEEMIRYLRQSGKVYWMGECDGFWDLIFEMIAKSDYEFYQIKNYLISKFSSIIVSSYGDLIVDVKQYPKMYFTKERAEPVTWAGEIVDTRITELDRRILSVIVNDARIPLIKLSERVDASAQTVSARLNRMKREGIILQYRISVDLKKLGLEMYKAIIHLDSYDREDEKRFEQYISEIPNSNYLIRNLWHIEPEFVVSDYHEYTEILDDMKKSFPKMIRNVESTLLRTDEWTPNFGGLFDKV